MLLLDSEAGFLKVFVGISFEYPFNAGGKLDLGCASGLCGVIL